MQDENPGQLVEYENKGFVKETVSKLKNKVSDKKRSVGQYLLKHDQELAVKNQKLIGHLEGFTGQHLEILHNINDNLTGFNPVANWLVGSQGKEVSSMDWEPTVNRVQALLESERENDYMRVHSGPGKYQKALGPSESIVPYAAYPPMPPYDINSIEWVD